MDFRWIAIIALTVATAVALHTFNIRVHTLEKHLKARENEVSELNAILKSIENKAIYAVDTSTEIIETVNKEDAKIWKRLRELTGDKDRIISSLDYINRRIDGKPDEEIVPTTPNNDDPYVEYDVFIPWDAP